MELSAAVDAAGERRGLALTRTRPALLVEAAKKNAKEMRPSREQGLIPVAIGGRIVSQRQ